MSTTSESSYYQHSGKIALASRISYFVRQQIFKKFMDIMQPLPEHTVLDVGVTNDIKFRESNFFEQFYPYKSQITCVGTEDGSHLEEQYTGLKFIKVSPGEVLPFKDQQFDIIFSNAVLEHVGNSFYQRAFLNEICRVGKRIFITTPNRWFPIEHHTGVPFLHYLPKPIYRFIIARTALNYWSKEENLNLLTLNELNSLFEDNSLMTIERVGVGMGIFRSNLVAYNKLQATSDLSPEKVNQEE